MANEAKNFAEVIVAPFQEHSGKCFSVRNKPTAVITNDRVCELRERYQSRCLNKNRYGTYIGIKSHSWSHANRQIRKGAH